MLQGWTGKNFSFFKDIKGLQDRLKGKSINSDETLVSFDVSALLDEVSR